MATIAASDARGLFTKMLIDVYRERTVPTSFLRSFFPNKEASTFELSIEVERGTEKIAADVERGTEGNRNSFSRSTEKIFIPPYYREYFDATELALYDRLFGSTDIETGVFTQFMESVAEKLGALQDKIERSYEKQCSEVLTTGIVTLKKGINIDFKRKADSLVDKGAGNYWATTTVNPFLDFEAGGNFLRQIGKAQGNVINVLFGSTALSDFMFNPFVQERQNIRHISLDVVRMPQKNSVGAALHGEFSAGSYIFRMWTYPEFYDNEAGVSTPYLDPKQVILLPEAPRFRLGFAAVPQLIDEANPVPRRGAYIIGDYKDQRNHKHIWDIRSAGVAIPVAVDQIYTVKVVA